MNAERPTLRKGALGLMARSLAASLAGGTLRLYSGERGGESTLLAAPRFEKQYDVTEDGVIKFPRLEMVKAVGMGRISWFLASGWAGNVGLIEGTVGKAGSLPGGKDPDMIVDDPQLYPGMEVTLEDGFEYRLRVSDE